jgi:hypothetical protein
MAIDGILVAFLLHFSILILPLIKEKLRQAKFKEGVAV